MIYSYIQENEEKIISRGARGCDVTKIVQNYSCQNIVIINGKKMTIEEFRENKGGI